MSDPAITTDVQPLSCEACRDLLSDYLDRELSQAERQAVENHLRTCTKCVTESTRLKGLKKVVQHWNGVKGSGEFHRIVLDKMIRESQQVPSKQFTDAAAQAAPVPGEPQPPQALIPPVWILIGAVVLAVVAYLLVRWM